VGDEWDIADGMALSRHGEQEDMSDVFEWGTATPESQGMDGARLEAMQRELAERDTKAFLVIRHDRLVWERYAPDFSAGTPHYTASMAKVFVAGMALLVQMADGRMGIDDPAWKYIPRWKDHALKSQITIRHLATHTSGIEDAEEPGKSLDELGGWKGAFWRGDRDPGPFAIALDQAPMLFAPGTSTAYSSPGMAALGYAITASLRGCQQSDLRSLLRARVMDPIGVPENHWRPGGDPPWELDGLRLYASWGGGHYTARAAARVGRLMLRRGDWEGRQVIDARRVCEALSPAAPAQSDAHATFGITWWINNGGQWPGLPRDAFAAGGAGHQVLLIVPSLDLMAVRNGNNLNPQDPFWRPIETCVFGPLMEAVRDRSHG
jgi:CubicO group peptidase (beta-lactamase class C family)